MSRDVFKTFLTDRYFRDIVKYIRVIEVKMYGRLQTKEDPPVDKECVLIAAKPDVLVKMGYGKLVDYQTFIMFSKFDLGLNDFIEHKGERYQRQNFSDYTDYGFNKYIISIYNEENLNKEDYDDNI